MKRVTLILLLFTILIFTLGADQQLSYWTFTVNGRTVPFRINIYEYSSGGSGYYELVNESSNTIRVSWTIYFNNGKSSSGSHTLRPGEKSTGSCYSCATGNSGVSDIELRKYEVQ